MTTMTAPTYSAQQPWFPPAEPVEFPQGRLKPEWVGKVAKSDTGDVVIRSHLMPRRPGDTRYLAAWRTFWRSLAFANRAGVTAMLHRWYADADAELASPGLGEAEATILRRFRSDVTSALNRLARAKNEPMSWAGAEFAKYQPEQRVMVEALIGAIALHRGGELSDGELYTVLGCLDVDPDNSLAGISEKSLAAIGVASRSAEPLALWSTYRKS